MKKKVAKIVGLIIFIILVILAICNIYSSIVSGKQDIIISTSSKAYTDSNLYVSIIAQKNGLDLDTKSNVKLLNSDKKEMKDVKVTYDESNAILGIPKIEPGKYYIEAKVSSEAGHDTVKKEIYISDGNSENITISLDKGIYKPGDIVNFRALITDKENDIPKNEDVQISIYDGNNNKVYNENVKSSDYGIISGKFTLANEVNSGLYKLIIKTSAQETTKQFKVNPYITPKYELKVSYNKNNYLVGDTAKVKIDAKYFFGEPVQNASIQVFIDGNKYKTLSTNNEGIAEFDYKNNTAKSYSLKLEAVDNSNYFVEETSSFIAGTDLFEIEILPEYGSLVGGRKNSVYVFTKKADGTPIKTYVTISSDNFTKQIATDENGIGHFSIDVERVNNNYSTYWDDDIYNHKIKASNAKKFTINSKDMEGNEVTKNVLLTIENKDLILSTNKVKYNQGEDISIDIASLKDTSKNIYFFKNDKLIKMISTDSDKTTVNLNDNYGLIDIFITENANSSISSYNDYYSPSNLKYTSIYKRTIFIIPSKKLNIQISTDKSEYKPGEKISILFNTTDENNSGIDSALLVSMLDNSVLKLADNDLSIDNIKLALQDINFTDDLDAATLYSCIVNDSSEQSIMGLLLKQSDKNLNISKTKIRNTEDETNAMNRSIVLVALIAIIIVTFLCIKFKKFRSFVKHALNYIIFFLTISQLVFCIIDEHFWENGYTWSMSIGIAIITLAVYIALLSKIALKLFNTTLSLIICTLIFIIFTFLIKELNISPNVAIIVLSSIILIGVIISKLSKMHNWKINKYTKKISKWFLHIFVLVIEFIISLFIGHFIEEISNIYGITAPVCIIAIYLIDYLLSLVFVKDTDQENQDSGENSKAIKRYLKIILEIVGAIVICFFVINFLRYGIPWDYGGRRLSRGMVFEDEIDFQDIESSSKQYTLNGNAQSNSVANSEKSSSSILDGIGEFFSIAENSSKQTNEETTNNMNEPQESSQSNATTDNKVRNVFLESMCFIPELVTTNGNAKLDLDLSDNITTWTIQTVGNTKNGKIGYGSIDNVKVFKNFFVDFELPKNLVVSDRVSIPVTVYNYTENTIDTKLEIAKADWFSYDQNNIDIKIDAKSSKLVYIPINILKDGENTFRVQASDGNYTDIIEKQCTISPKGKKIEKVVSTGLLNEDISEDILVLDKIIENTAKAKIKIYASTISQAVDGIENIFRMPSGCFEQVSSSLYPNILALKYLQDTGIVNEKLKEKALSYISTGYQKILTYEVREESGGYSLYGRSPAETVLTAYGLMEVSDLANVYKVDESVIKNMKDFLYGKQNFNGSFTITGYHLGGASSSDSDSLNAYITWALSESDPKDSRLQKSIDYLKNKLDNIQDNYTLALIANVLANVNDNKLNDVLKRLVNNISLDGNRAYLTTNIVDYYGTRGNIQNVQTVALASMALSKASYNPDTNKMFINYIINKKDVYGTWYSTQATILALKALNTANQKNSLGNQTIKVSVNTDVKEIKINNNPLEVYEVTFDKLNKEKKLNIDIEKGDAYYEVVEEYYIPYEDVNSDNDNISVEIDASTDLKVNDILEAKIKLTNESKNNIYNGMVKISIPQGFSVVEESLMELEKKGVIEKYETSYSTINIYLRNFEYSNIVNLRVSFRAMYPVNITGLAVNVYDYYNPEIQGKSLPIKIDVK